VVEPSPSSPSTISSPAESPRMQAKEISHSQTQSQRAAMHRSITRMSSRWTSDNLFQHHRAEPRKPPPPRRAIFSPESAATLINGIFCTSLAQSACAAPPRSDLMLVFRYHSMDVVGKIRECCTHHEDHSTMLPGSQTRIVLPTDESRL
jgi:hypothetical protein